MDKVIAIIPFEVGVEFVEETRTEIPKSKPRASFTPPALD